MLKESNLGKITSKLSNDEITNRLKEKSKYDVVVIKYNSLQQKKIIIKENYVCINYLM